MKFIWTGFGAQPLIVGDETDYGVHYLQPGRGYGKALAVTTSILTGVGWKMMAEIKAGDTVFRPDGQQTTVTWASDIMFGHRCYRVIFSDGAEIVADEDHLWVTETHQARKASSRNGWKTCQGEVFTTKEIRDSLLYPGRERNHSIPVAAPPQFPECSLPIQPYTLGAWLGDGASRGALLTCSHRDKEIVEQIAGDGYNIKLMKTAGDKCPCYLIGGALPERNLVTGRMQANGSIHSKLKEMCLLRNKHIPPLYFFSSVSQRLALLQGLMDTDGSVCKGHCEFTSINQQLASDVHALCISLGLKATLITGEATLDGRDCGPKYRVCFTPYIPVFRLTRKLQGLKEPGAQAKRQSRRYIKSVIEVPSVPVRCIKIADKDGLFLSGSALISTHNTETGAVCLWWMGLKYPRIQGMVTAPSYHTLERATLPKIREKSQEFGLIEGRDWDFNWKRMELDLKLTGSQFYFATTDDPELLPGPNLGFLWMDEARNSPFEAFSKLQGCLRGGDWPHKTVVTTTPVSKAHWLYQTFYPIDGERSVIEHRRQDFGISDMSPEMLHELRLDRLPPFRQTVTKKRVKTPKGIITITYNAYEGWTLDNPYSGAETYAAMVDSLGGPYTPMARRELFGEHIYMEGLVYDTWNRDYHVKDESLWPTRKPNFVVGGIDFGYSASPNVVVVLGVDGAGRGYILDESYDMRMDQEQLIPVLRRMEKQWRPMGWAVDTENPQWRVFLRQHHINALSARKKFKDTKGNPSAGIGLCSSIINKRMEDGSQGFFVSPRCKHFIEGIENYVWKDTRSEVPDKKYSDAPDAFRYAAGLAYNWGYGAAQQQTRMRDMRVAA